SSARRCEGTPAGEAGNRLGDSLSHVNEDRTLDIDLLASSLQADGGDVRLLLKALVTRLAGALGDRLKVERAGGRLRRSDEIRRVSVTLGDDTLDASVNGTD